MSVHRRNKGHNHWDTKHGIYQPWFWPSVGRRRKRNLLAKISRRVKGFTRRLMKKARKSYIRRQGFLAQGFIPTKGESVRTGVRKYMQLREKSSRRGMDGTMR
jgi:hypothetical protein